jgi:predicted negative regulator of RcsB-dependent stress response
MLPGSAKPKVNAMKKLSPVNISLIAVIVIFIAGAAAWYFYNESQKSGFVKGAEKTEEWGKNVAKDTKKLFTK